VLSLHLILPMDQFRLLALPRPDLALSRLAVRRPDWLAPGEARYYTESRVADGDGVRSAHDPPSRVNGRGRLDLRDQANPRYKEHH